MNSGFSLAIYGPWFEKAMFCQLTLLIRASRRTPLTSCESQLALVRSHVPPTLSRVNFPPRTFPPKTVPIGVELFFQIFQASELKWSSLTDVPTVIVLSISAAFFYCSSFSSQPRGLLAQLGVSLQANGFFPLYGISRDQRIFLRSTRF